MNRRLLLPLLLLVVALSGCASHATTAPHTQPTPAPTSCTPPPGGRCAADVAWPGPIHLSADGQRLHGIVNCGGTLRATESADTVTITLHVGRMGPGTMSCARVDVGVHLAAPLGQRTVVDGVSGKPVRVAGS
jgi:hypothetical protein